MQFRSGRRQRRHATAPFLLRSAEGPRGHHQTDGEELQLPRHAGPCTDGRRRHLCPADHPVARRPRLPSRLVDACHQLPDDSVGAYRIHAIAIHGCGKPREGVHLYHSHRFGASHHLRTHLHPTMGNQRRRIRSGGH